jgi:hypothetical protein
MTSLVYLANNDGPIIMAPNNNVANYIYFNTSGTTAKMLPNANNTGAVGAKDMEYNSMYSKAFTVGDWFANKNPNYLIRFVETDEGMATQFIPRDEIVNCPDENVMTQITLPNGSVEERPESETDCWMRVGDEVWDTTQHSTQTFDGDVTTSDGSMRDMLALKAVLVDKGVLTENEVSAKVQQMRQLGGGLRT